MKLSQILLFPFSVLYGMIMRLRNFFYDKGIFVSRKFKIPVICVGNLSVGGTGKSPHIEYLIKLLSANYKLATLSRGYGRKSKGFVLVDKNSNYTNTGDEPLQFKKKFENITVAVDENRVRGIDKIISFEKNIDVILLDDAFQHRKVQPGLSVLLTDYSSPFYNDWILPAGKLREPSSGAKRADIIIVTKIPEKFLDGEKEQIISRINPSPNQQVYFSKVEHDDFIPITSKAINSKKVIKEYFFDAEYTILLFTGIANSTPLVNYLSSKSKELIHVEFPDHHSFSGSDINKVLQNFAVIQNSNKIILTTEKDSIRLVNAETKSMIDEYPVYYIPITIAIDDSENFNKQIIQYVTQNKRGS